MAQRKLLTNGSAFKRTDGRWCGVVWYMDEQGERKRKSFCGSTKHEVMPIFDKKVLSIFSASASRHGQAPTLRLRILGPSKSNIRLIRR